MKNKYCRKCGRKLLQIKVGAEEVIEYYGCDGHHPYSEYSQETGKRQYGTKFKCPKQKWYNSHTIYTELTACQYNSNEQKVL